ncbi:MAG: DUF1294 domain-containing protein [Oscillospiraceae bacterium]|nr:DUF1294 domain-containing protein [Oscillospiraceae bacterium]
MPQLVSDGLSALYEKFGGPLFWPVLAALAYLLTVNLTAFFLFWRDKALATRHLRRIPEAALLRWAALGGAGGALCGMLVCRHKTRKPKFVILVPLLAAVWTAALILLVLFFAGRL